jgi:CBS domain-containing protein
MQAKDIMTTNPACCAPETSVREVARMMVEHDCGEIPVIDEADRPIGVITDRDISCRMVAQGLDGNTCIVRDFMTMPAVTVHMLDTLERCCSLMEDKKIRRVPVVDDSGRIEGIISQADFAKKADSYSVSHLVKEVSMPTASSARDTV